MTISDENENDDEPRLEDNSSLDTKGGMYAVESWRLDRESGIVTHEVRWITEEEMLAFSEDVEAEAAKRRAED